VNDKVLISVVIPCYNQAQYLINCVKSVIRQSFIHWECIIVDDGSPDNTKEIALELVERDDRIKYIPKINGGVSSARNLGIENSTGEFILPLDADDYISDNYLEMVYSQITTSVNVKVVYGLVSYFGVVNSSEKEVINFDFVNHLYSNQIHCSGLYRRVDAIAIGGYDEAMIFGYEDWDFYIRLIGSSYANAIQLEGCILYYRIKEVSRNKILHTDGKDLITMNYMIAKNMQFYSEANINFLNQIRIMRNQSVNPEFYFAYSFILKLTYRKILNSCKEILMYFKSKKKPRY
jgi:glycosyltransferase involved in cell wall biosynthesis